MLDYLEKLRKKPEPERRKAAFLIALSVTLAVALIWGIGLMFRIQSTNFTFVDNSPEKSMPSFKQTMSNFIDQVSTIFSNADQNTDQATTTNAAPAVTVSGISTTSDAMPNQ
ncbi:MAG TPA: hypothetical protein VFT82_00935 [Candidatus Paceibacterota bacterium]|nr:hypothetical protein [Candidatus Paceibacterota bacterium]